MPTTENIQPEMTVTVIEGNKPTCYVVDAVIDGFVSVRAKGRLHYTIPMSQIVDVRPA